METNNIGRKPKSEPKNILVVDDDRSVRTIFSSILKQEGYRVTAVKDGYEAIKVVEQEDFGLALVDVRLPGLDGIEVLEKIKSKRLLISLSSSTTNTETILSSLDVMLLYNLLVMLHH